MYILTIWPKNSTSSYSEEIKTYVHIKACTWISLQPQQTQNEQNLIVCQGVSLSSKMELTIDSCNMDEYQKCEAEQKKQDTQEYILCDSIYVKL